MLGARKFCSQLDARALARGGLAVAVGEGQVEIGEFAVGDRYAHLREVHGVELCEWGTPACELPHVHVLLANAPRIGGAQFGTCQVAFRALPSRAGLAQARLGAPEGVLDLVDARLAGGFALRQAPLPLEFLAALDDLALRTSGGSGSGLEGEFVVGGIDAE